MNSTQFRESLVTLKKLILIGGPHDSVITPWQSSHFGYFNENGDVESMHDREIYKNDTIGLRTLDEKKKLEIITVPHIHHFMWHLNITLIKEIILPWLD